MELIFKTVLSAVVLLLAGCDTNAAKHPTAIDFGDSVSLGYSGPARFDLNGKVDYRHNPWMDENIAAYNSDYYFWNETKHGENDGWSYTLLVTMEQELSDQHYNVILFNAGLHDAQKNRQTTLSAYRLNLEAIATLAAKHADYVIWVDTTPVPADVDAASGMLGTPEDAQIPYNAVAEDVARAHGFYILNLDSQNQLPHNVHYTFEGYKYLGKQVSACILLVLERTYSNRCHK